MYRDEGNAVLFITCKYAFFEPLLLIDLASSQRESREGLSSPKQAGEASPRWAKGGCHRSWRPLAAVSLAPPVQGPKGSSPFRVAALGA